jgi:hypothetical protein
MSPGCEVRCLLRGVWKWTVLDGERVVRTGFAPSWASALDACANTVRKAGRS